MNASGQTQAKLEEALAAAQTSPPPSEDRTQELEAEAAGLRERLSELEQAHLEALREEQGRRAELQAAHDSAVAALEERVAESLELAEQVEGDRDTDLAALRATLEEAHADEAAALRARLEEARALVEAKEAAASDLAAECERLAAECERLAAEAERAGDEAREAADGLAERLRAEEEARAAVEGRLEETIASVRV